jgi:flagellar protein FlbD
MIELTKLQNQKFVLNAELIESIEETPDTIITLVSGKRIMVKETVAEVVERVVEYKTRCLTASQSSKQEHPPAG